MQTLTSLMNHLENNKDSQTLSLAYASVGDDGVGEVARFVRDNVFVKYLDLRGNNIQAKGAVVLANGQAKPVIAECEPQVELCREGQHWCPSAL
jgi:hypothetical protein